MTALVRYRIGCAGANAIALSVEDALRFGALLPGALLPPVRTLAADLEVSPTTVASAYRLLAARGLVTGQGRRGTRVTPRPPLRTPVPTPVPEDLHDVASGNPDAVLLATLPIKAIHPRPRLYGGERVQPKLIDLGRKLLQADGIPTDSLTVVGGALDGLERVLQAHLRAGDRVAVEDPASSGLRPPLWRETMSITRTRVPATHARPLQTDGLFVMCGYTFSTAVAMTLIFYAACAR